MLSFNNPNLGLGTCLDNREKWRRVWIIEKNGVAYNNSQVVRGCVSADDPEIAISMQKLALEISNLSV